MRPSLNRRVVLLGIAVLAAWPRAGTVQPAVQSRAEAAQRELLNSERIERRFGSYGVEVLHSDAALRISNLYSETDGARTGRTFAVVRYPAEVDPAFGPEHAAILAGGSIGAVFAAAGWAVTKRHLWFGSVEATDEVARRMRIAAGVPVAVHIYVLFVSRDDATIEYAAIAEIHHPEYLRLDDLPPIYGAPAYAESRADPLVEDMLAAAHAAMR